MTRLLISDVTVLNDPAAYAGLYSKASPVRRAAADSFRFVRDRNLSLGAAALLDIGLRQFGLYEKEMSYGHNENGKPYFENAPGINFSISHSSTKVAVAFSDGEVGCDIEEIRTFDPDVAEVFFSGREFDMLISIEDPYERNRALYRQWTLKESYMKAVGAGLTLPSRSFSIAEDASGLLFVSDEEDVIPRTGFSFITPETVPGYGCALCFMPECGTPEVLNDVLLLQ